MHVLFRTSFSFFVFPFFFEEPFCRGGLNTFFQIRFLSNSKLSQVDGQTHLSDLFGSNKCSQTCLANFLTLFERVFQMLFFRTHFSTRVFEHVSLETKSRNLLNKQIVTIPPSSLRLRYLTQILLSLTREFTKAKNSQTSLYWT